MTTRFPLARRLTDYAIRADGAGCGITRIRLTSRLTGWLGIEVTPYVVADGDETLLIDTGYAHVRPLMLDHLRDHNITAIACTHHHEDHVGNAAAIAQMHGCPCYLRHPDRLRDEGVHALYPYRQVYWGAPDPGMPRPMPDRLGVGRRVFEVIPTPGHSVSHIALYEEATGLLFSGDLYLTRGVSAVMAYENPHALCQSLRRVAAVAPSRMLTGHGHLINNPARLLLRKAERIEQAASKVLELHQRGLDDREILGRIFARGQVRDRIVDRLTSGEYSRTHFVRACIVHKTT